MIVSVQIKAPNISDQKTRESLKEIVVSHANKIGAEMDERWGGLRNSD